MKKRFLASILAVTMMFALAGAGTMAWFTSQDKSEGNTFTAGTLIVGGDDSVADADLYFARVAFENMEPGQPPQKLETTTIKNRGSLPFYLYRLTADNFSEDESLDSVLNINVKIGGEEVYSGKISQLREDNGGFFDPIKDIQPGTELPMEIEVFMDPTAENEFQGTSMTCDLTIYASQNEKPSPGEPTGTKVNLGSTSLFRIEGYNTNGWVNFDWNWTPNDVLREEYLLKIKHHNGDATTTIYEARIWWDGREWVESTDGLDRDDVQLLVRDDVVRIRRSAFPEDWDGFEVELSGRQSGFVNRETIPYQYWSLGR